VCRRIDKNTGSSCRNIDCFTNGFTVVLFPSVFHREVVKKLRSCATISDGFTDGMGKLPTVLLTARWPSAVDISQRVVKKLRSCATFTDGHHRQKSPTEITHPEAHASQRHYYRWNCRRPNFRR
jgi:hypothetical protein